jgi:hypothetical protein
MSDKPFPSAWLGRCGSAPAREEFKEYLLNSRKIFDELEHLLQREEDSITRGEADFSDAAWPYKMAHYIGQREMISRIRKLIP